MILMRTLYARVHCDHMALSPGPPVAASLLYKYCAGVVTKQ